MNTDIINPLNMGDSIIATLDCNGRRLASVNGTHFSSLEAVKRALISLAGTYAGMAVLTVRNCTRGWRNVSAWPPCAALSSRLLPLWPLRRASVASISSHGPRDK